MGGGRTPRSLLPKLGRQLEAEVDGLCAQHLAIELGATRVDDGRDVGPILGPIGEQLEDDHVLRARNSDGEAANCATVLRATTRA